MERKEREAILRQGVVRPETPRDRAEREALETDLIDSPVVGQPLRQRLRNFRPSSDAAVRAIGGPLAWMRRLREIELRIAEHEARLPMNPRTGDFVTVNGRPYTREPLDARWILARFAAR